ncbi:MAG TPA: hypothetical protein DD384_06985 [Firmicutes bacterium]|nr:hypothetical protein [Bacillota bacterium]
MNMSFSLDDYNQEQLEAISSSKNKVCVYAGPGTGKTKTLVGRYVYLINEEYIDPKNILCLTFTRKAAEEMSHKISNVCKDNMSKYIGTIHGMGNKILKQEVYHLSFPNNYSILDDDMMDSILYDIFNSLKINWKERGITFADAKEFFSLAKANMPDGYIDCLLDRNKAFEVKNRGTNEKEKKLWDVFEAYLSYQTINAYLDYSDLVHVTNYLFRKLPNICEKWAKRFHYILVDEFQDLTYPEMEFINHLASCHGRIFGVGDPDQSIYSFRGSKPEIFYDFYGMADARFSFKKNYRSKQEIIDLSHDMISYNDNRGDVDVRLSCVKGNGTKPILVHTNIRHDEMCFISKTIGELVGKGAHYRDFAILFRTNQQALEVEEHFLIKKIPYMVYSRNAFFKAEEIKTALAYIRFMLYKDNASFDIIIRKFNQYISNCMLNLLKEKAHSKEKTYWQTLLEDYKNYEYKGRFDDFVKFVQEMEEEEHSEHFLDWCINLFYKSKLMDNIMESGDPDKASNMTQLMEMIRNYEPDNPLDDIAEQFLGYTALLQEGDCKNDKDLVQMMTVHCSKGLQFKYVFIIDFNENIMPSSKAENKADLQEERRIAYVGFTRAMEKLYILESKCGDSRLKLSTFADSFDKAHFEEIKYVSKDRPDDLPTIQYGSFVKSPFYGRGVVQSVNYKDRTCTVKFIDCPYPKENISFDKLINIVDKNALNILVSPEKIVEAKKNHPSQYQVGDIVLHSEYGTGMVLNVLEDRSVVIQFKNGKETCPIDSNHLITREDYLEYKSTKDQN